LKKLFLNIFEKKNFTAIYSMEKSASIDVRNINTHISTSGTDSQNSEKSEPGSRKIIPNKSDRKPLSNDEIGPSDGPPLRPAPNIEQRHNGHLEISFDRLSIPDSRAPVRDVREAQQFYRRIPSRTKSTPDLTTNKKEPFNFQAGLRRRRLPEHRSQLNLAKKSTRGNKLISTSSQWSSEVLPRINTQPPRNLRSLEPSPPVQGSSVFGLLSRLTSLISSPNLESLDEQVLNEFNIEVGTIASRVDMWRQKLEDERSTSVRSHTRSVDTASPPNPSSHNWAFAFISDEIQHLLQLTGNLTSSMFGSSSWGLFHIENRLMVLLQMGSSMVYPVIEVLVMNLWRMLREILNLHWDDTEKVGGLSSVIDAINNAFYAIRSLIHLGNAYRNAQEPSDSDYTGDSRSVLTHSLGSLNLREEEQKYD